MIVSGFAGLGYQIVWTQQVALSLGTESASVSGPTLKSIAAENTPAKSAATKSTRSEAKPAAKSVAPASKTIGGSRAISRR